MSLAVEPIGLDSLPNLPLAEVQMRNRDLQHFARREFVCAGVSLRFQRVTGHEAAAQRGDVWLALQFAGSPVVLRVARDWAQLVANSAGVALADLHNDTLNLLCLTRLVPKLPPGVRYEMAAFSQDSLGVTLEGLDSRGSWAASNALSGEPCNYRLQLWAAEGFPVYAFFAAFDAYVRRFLPSALQSFPLSLPLVAARWSIEADQLVGLELGDVLIIG